MNPDVQILGAATEEETEAVLLALRAVLADAAAAAARATVSTPAWGRPGRYRSPSSWAAQSGSPLSRPDAFAA